ncbi:MAG TPA: CHRD domain-containing protein [Flavisolibacter sp.]|nr:CHRD domain-containing protein [Flavisolibacter sp.]
MKKMKRFAFAIAACLMVFTSCEKEEMVDRTAVSPGSPLAGAQQIPANNSTATGTIGGTYDRRSRNFNYTLSWAGLSGPPAAIHIHGIADAGFIALPSPLGPYTNGIAQTISGFPAAASGSLTGTLFVDGNVIKEHELLGGKFYIDIHTAAFPMGEIRGQILFPQ